MIFHEKYTKQFIWKKAESSNNVEEQSTQNGQNSKEEAENGDKSYIEKVDIISTFAIQKRANFLWI